MGTRSWWAIYWRWLAWSTAKTTFICNRMRETQFKILHRSKMDKRVSPLCVKCKMSVGTYIHYFWECRLIVRFWSNVAQEFSKIFSLKITRDPGLFILSLPSKTLSLSRTDFKLCDKLLFLCILKQWIRDKPPTVTQWYLETYKVLPLERHSTNERGW